MYRYLLVLSILLSPILLSPTLVSAQVEAAARTYFDAGNLAFGEARWVDCARDFERSFSIVFAPELLYNVGLCYQRAASTLPDAEAGPFLERSLVAYQRYLREIPTATDAGPVRTSISDLQGRLTRISTPDATSEVPEVASVEVPDATSAAPEIASAVPPVAEAVTVPRGEYVATVSTGALAVLSTVIAIGLGVHAQDLYSNLSATCGRTEAGCTASEISEVDSYAVGANAMYGVSGIALADTGVAFGFEFTATTTVLRVGGSF